MEDSQRRGRVAGGKLGQLGTAAAQLSAHLQGAVVKDKRQGAAAEGHPQPEPDTGGNQHPPPEEDSQAVEDKHREHPPEEAGSDRQHWCKEEEH